MFFYATIFRFPYVWNLQSFVLPVLRLSRCLDVRVVQNHLFPAWHFLQLQLFNVVHLSRCCNFQSVPFHHMPSCILFLIFVTLVIARVLENVWFCLFQVFRFSSYSISFQLFVRLFIQKVGVFDSSVFTIFYTFEISRFPYFYTSRIVQ